MRSTARKVAARAVASDGNSRETRLLDPDVRSGDRPDEVSQTEIETLPLWQLDIVELTGHNLEARGREEVNRLLEPGWRLLHIYTLKYRESRVWRERPMAILGRTRNRQPNDDPRRKRRMIPPLQITFRNIRSSVIVEDWIRDEAAKLASFYNRSIGCRVVVAIPHRHHRIGSCTTFASTSRFPVVRS